MHMYTHMYTHMHNQTYMRGEGEGEGKKGRAHSEIQVLHNSSIMHDVCQQTQQYTGKHNHYSGLCSVMAEGSLHNCTQAIAT